MNRFQSQPLDLPVDRSEVVRADLILYGVDHSGPTYEARIFLDNPKATEETPRDAEAGYAGSYTVFGHGGCFGGEGHCALKERYSDDFDRRLPHPLTPADDVGDDHSCACENRGRPGARSHRRSGSRGVRKRDGNIGSVTV